MKTDKKLSKIGENVENVNGKPIELTDDELNSVKGGIKIFVTRKCPYCEKDIILFMYNQHLSRCSKKPV